MSATLPFRPDPNLDATPHAATRSRLLGRLDRVVPWMQDHVFAVTVVMVFLFILIFLLPSEFIFIYPGQAGLLWRRFFFGQVQNRVYLEGTQMIWPWDKMFVYNLRAQDLNDTVHLLTTDGLDVSVDLSVRTRLLRENLPALNEQVGPKYVTVVVLPELEAATRKVLEQYQAEQLHSANQEDLADDIKKNMIAAPDMNLITVETINITRITLPKTVQDAIQAKNAEQQKNLLLDFRIQEQQKEASRLKIEGEGIKGFQDAAGSSLTDRYLLLQAIQATQALANSPNTKTIIVGAGKEGLPILLGDQLSNAASPAAVVAPAPTSTPSSVPASAAAIKH